MTSFERGASVTGMRLMQAADKRRQCSARHLCAWLSATFVKAREVWSTSFQATRRRAPSPLSVFNPSDWEFVLRDWWREPRSASGRWYEYELRGPLGCAVGVGDTALAAVTDAGREYTRRFERMRVA